ncbi:hypothetical protein Tco_0607771 [Tanacetum coccineum]
MPSSPSSPHRHHHLLVIIPTPPLPSSPPRTITSTHAKHHRDNLLEGASGGGNSTRCVWFELSRKGCLVWVAAATGGVELAVGQPGIAEGRDVGFGAAGT